MNVLIIGESSSVGKELRKELELRAWTVYGTAHKHQAARNTCVVLDLDDEESVRRLPDQFPAGLKFGAVVALAAVLHGKSLTYYTAKEMAQVMAVNVLGHALAIQTLYMRDRLAEPAHVILMSSIAAERGSFDPLYAASKAGLIGLGKSLAQSLPHVRVNMLTPGLIEGSTMYGAMLPGIRERHRSATHDGKLLQLWQIARIIGDLLEPEWGHLNGAVIPINGGAYV